MEDKRIHMYDGNRSFFDSTWTKKIVFDSEDEAYWDICYRRKGRSKHLEVRVVSQVKVKHKANYDLYWNGEKLTGEDSISLSEHRTILHKLVTKALPKNPKEIPATTGKARAFKADVNRDNWVDIAELGAHYGVEWVLAKRKMAGASTSSWTGLLIYAKTEADHKASYHTAWNGERFSAGSDIPKLEEHRPGLYEAVEMAIAIYL